jgi:hypothetical protein
MLVNIKLDMNHWAQLSIPKSNDLTPIQFSDEDEYGHLMIFDIYNDCLNTDTIKVMDEYIKQNKQKICA